jgi:hypothetical protein
MFAMFAALRIGHHFFNLNLPLRGKRFRRLLLARWNVLALIGKSLLHGFVS